MRSSNVFWALAMALAAMGLSVLAERFEWPLWTGMVLFLVAMAATLSACFYCIFRPFDSGNAEVAKKIADAYANVDARMHDTAMDIARKHLRGEVEPGTPQHRILEIQLRPAEMRAAFRATYGASIEDPGMKKARAQWEESWLEARFRR